MILTLTDHVHCADCDALVPVTLQRPMSDSVVQVADDLAALAMEAKVRHDLDRHLGEIR